MYSLDGDFSSDVTKQIVAYTGKSSNPGRFWVSDSSRESAQYYPIPLQCRLDSYLAMTAKITLRGSHSHDGNGSLYEFNRRAQRQARSSAFQGVLEQRQEGVWSNSRRIRKWTMRSEALPSPYGFGFWVISW
jgi:hypothetical protein